ncbi:MAG: hypothetical protein SFV53_01495 [Rickettsiales bacterium]|nr:hypothetical protein [Rickettsiales bacterium]
MTSFVDKIIIFLEKELEKSSDSKDRENRLEVIEYFKKSKGQCHGLSVLQAYGRMIEDEGEIERNSTDSISFFNKVKTTLLDWNNQEDQLDRQQVADIERLISNILLYQRADLEVGKPIAIFYPSQDPSLELTPGQTVLQDTFRGNIIKSFDYDSSLVLTKKMLKTRLEKVVKPNNIILIHSKSENGEHTNSIYQSSSGKIYLSNNENEIAIENLDDLTEKLWDVTDKGNFVLSGRGFKYSDLLLRNITGVQIYKFANGTAYDYPTNLAISKDEFKEFSLEHPKFTEFIKIDALFESFSNSISVDDAYDLYQDWTIENEDLKTALLSRLTSINENYCRPILALPPIVMSKEMLLDRLTKLNKEEIGSIVITYEIEGPKRQISEIGRGYYDEDNKPLKLFLEDPCGCLDMDQAIDILWQHSKPSNFKIFGLFKASELFFRKIGLYVFDDFKNKQSASVCPTEEFFKATPQELESFYAKNPNCKKSFNTSPFLMNDELVLSFLNQFDNQNAKEEEQHPYASVKPQSSIKASGKIPDKGSIL